MNNGQERSSSEKHRINQRIRVPEVRVIDEGGSQLGIMSTWQALNLARDKGLDLVEVNVSSRPPVCKLMDYGKLKYNEKKQERKNKANHKTQKTKEILLRPKTDDHDFDFKVKHIKEFLQGGDKVQITIQFRGREIVHPEEGRKKLLEVITSVKHLCKIDYGPVMEGKKMLLILSPLEVKPEPSPKIICQL